MEFPLARAVIDAGLAGRAFPAAVIDVGRASGSMWRAATGRLRFEPDAPACTVDTVFDLASLTKVIATATCAARLQGAGVLDVDARVGMYLPEWNDPSHEAIGLRHLFDHSSGLPAHRRLWEQAHGRVEFAAAIHACGLDRPVGSSAVYSDLGFIVLGFILERVAGVALDTLMTDLARTLDTPALCYRPPESWRGHVAPTEFDSWRNRLLVGEVHDENAAALDGVAGHAGLFGTVGDVASFARAVLETFTDGPRRLAGSAVMRMFAARSAVPGSSRALGWDTMLPTSSCGARLSSRAIGHTGFTGTSLWIDPEQDLYVAFLTNRVHPTRNNDSIRGIRPRLHDAIVEDLERSV